MGEKLKSVLFWLGLVIYSFCLVFSTKYIVMFFPYIGNSLFIFLSSVQLFILIYVIFHIARILKKNIWLCGFILIFLSSVTTYILFSIFVSLGLGLFFSVSDTFLISIVIAFFVIVGALIEKFLNRKFRNHPKLSRYINLLFVILALPAFVSALWGTATLFIVDIPQIKQLDDHRIDKKDIEPYYKSAMAELQTHYKFKDFSHIDKFSENCDFAKIKDYIFFKLIDTKEDLSMWTFRCIFKGGNANDIFESALYYSQLYDGKVDNDMFDVNASFVREKGGDVKATFCYSDKTEELPLEEVAKKVLDFDEKLKKLVNGKAKK